MTKDNFEFKSLSSVKNCFFVLQLISENNHHNGRKGLPLRDIQKLSGFSGATAYRYLQSLEEYGLISKDKNGFYTLATKVVELYHSFIENNDLRAVAYDHMQKLNRKTEETVFLGILDHTEVFYIDKIDSRLPVRPYTKIGGRNKLHCTGLGKAILAFSNEELQKQILVKDLEAKTEFTIVDPKLLEEELVQTRTRGYSRDNMENEDQIRCVAAPIFNHTGDVIAALSISGPAFRMSDERMDSVLGPKVRDVCMEISKALGYVKD